MATTLKYNDVTLLNCLTTEFSQEIVYDDSQTDVIYDKIKISVQAVLVGIAVQSTGYYPDGRKPAIGLEGTKGDLEKNILLASQKLMEPRKELDYKAGTKNLLLSGPHNGQKDVKLDPFSVTQTVGSNDRYPDVNNGPKPMSFRVTKVVGDKAVEVEYSIETYVVRCSDPKNRSGILSNRWSVHDQIDDNWYCTRTFEGTLVVTSPNVDPDSFRGLFVPPLQKGFMRESIETTTDPSGLRLTYRVQDRQTSNAPPAPATKWSGSHTVSSSFDGSGMNNRVSVRVQLWGPEDTSKTDLLALAAAICRDRAIYKTKPGDDPKKFAPTLVNSLDITDHLAENSIEMHLDVTMPPQKISLAAIDASNVGSPLNLPKYDRHKAREPGVYGTATTTGRWICYLQSPCDDDHETRDKLQGLPDTPQNDTGGDGTAVKTYTGQVTAEPSQPTDVSGNQLQYQYTTYKIDSEYRSKIGTAVLPVASTANKTISPGDRTAYPAGLNRAVQYRIVRVECERLGSACEIPKPEDFTDQNGIHHTLVDSRQILGAPMLTADGVHYLHSATIEYEFAMSRPLINADKIITGSLPWDKSTVNQHLVPSEKVYKDGLIN